ncbi:discoidin domain-containing protein [Streptomyces sp. PSAA01]|uniref:discoidin domain-containing protein n=1 Tax=Streptomyces sp. PSAA01 TaxID=2912762 RepID=UPI001F23F5AF|nr:discoidin domain-containing protein [Streptomyces sp. PSAA01]MCG0290463.1 discoidin domain-containing protein [Streptomyces sp. PSAA01]
MSPVADGVTLRGLHWRGRTCDVAIGPHQTTVPGMYAGAAVDGNAATAWVPDAGRGTLTADLGRAVRLAKVSPEWTRTRPVSHEVRTSLDGRHWREGTTGPARYVRVTLRSADDKKRAGIEELRVTRAK